MTMATAIMGPLDVLSDDTLAHVLSFLDYDSAVIFSRETYTLLTERFTDSCFNHVWRGIYHRHWFSPVESSTSREEIDYMLECKERRELVQNLVQSQQQQRHCLNLPNRFFYFVPITPNDEDDMPWEDPPPVDFDCNSFVLTSPGCSGEFVFLDPFDMSLSVHTNATENAVASDEAMIRNAMMNAACAVVRRQAHGSSAEREEHIAGAIIDETVYRNHNVQDYRTPPSQVLIDVQSYFNVNLAEYFEMTQDRNVRRRTPQGSLLLHPDDEVDFGYIGIEAKPIVGTNGIIDGSMIGLGRFLCSLRIDGPQEEENISCTEIVTWRKLQGESTYGDVRICRVPWDIYCAETCSKSNRMYVVFYRGQGPLSQRVVSGDHDMDDAESSAIGQKTIVAYPLMPANETHAPSAPRYFPQPEFRITCSDFVSYVTVDCTGTLLVGTNNGTIEIWKPSGQSGMTRVAMLKCKDAVIESAKRYKAEAAALSADQNDDTMTMIHQEMVTLDAMNTDSLPTSLNGEEEEEVQDEGPHEPAVVENDDDEGEQLPRLLGSTDVESFHFPSHLPVEKCGFVSLQHSRVDGTSLLLWKNRGNDPGFRVVSQVNLPLSPRRKPRIHYDGRRIVVLGQDHIGAIILVYHVFCSNEDVGLFPPSASETKLSEESGGVYNYTSMQQPHVRFANRIRHAALGGLKSYENMCMTCNERFIIVNTKTGNLLGGGSPTGDGLLIIDLKEH